jgi:hypothetical protein
MDDWIKEDEIDGSITHVGRRNMHEKCYSESSRKREYGKRNLKQENISKEYWKNIDERID